MIDPIFAKLNRMIEHRAEIAYRWFGIKDTKTAAQFSFDDPDMQAYLEANPQVKDAIFMKSLQVWVAEIIDGVNIAKHRELLGDEIVDRIIAMTKASDG